METKYDIPEGYFEQLESEVLSKVDLSPKEPKRGKVIYLWSAITAVAASVLAFLFWPVQDSQTIFINMSESELAYLQIDEYDLLDGISDEQMTLWTEEFGAFSESEADAAWDYLAPYADEEMIYELL